MISQFISEDRMAQLGVLTLRYGMAIVFLWFGFSQLNNPLPWITFLPEWVAFLPVSQTHFVMFNGLFEVVGAALLLIGAFTRVSALLLGLHLVGIALSIGVTSTGVRDFGLAVASLALAGVGAGNFSIDALADQSNNEMVQFPGND